MSTMPLSFRTNGIFFWMERTNENVEERRKTADEVK